MPEILDRCVQHVMGQGHSESSAYAICRSQLGLKDDGSEDDKKIEMPDDEMEMRVAGEVLKRRFQNGPLMRKKMTVCTPFGEYVNGDQKGDMTVSRLRTIAENFKKHRRQVPVYMLGDHVEDPDEQLPVGWVEGLEFLEDVPEHEDGGLVADVKLYGDAALLVAQDLIRGASIGTVSGKNPDGSSQGEVLQHLLLTNNPFDRSLNIAAARKGGEPVACYFTALGGTNMAEKNADQEVAKLKEENKDLLEQVTALRNQKPDERIEILEAMLKETKRENQDLRAANENLTSDVQKYRKNPQLEEALVKLKAQERQILAERIRRLVGRGVSECKFTLLHVGEPSKGWDHNSDEAVLAWFKSSIFNGSMDRLEFALESFERKPVNQRFGTGTPKGETGEVILSQDDKDYIKKLGMDPEVVAANMSAVDFSEFKRNHPQRKEN